MPEEGTVQTLDFSTMSPANVDRVIAAGGEIPEDLLLKTDEETAKESEAAPEAKEEAKTEAEGEPTGEEIKAEEAKADEEKGQESDLAPDEDFVNNFKFSDNPEKVKAEEAEYLNKVELPAPVNQMIEWRDAKIVELETKQAETVQASEPDPIVTEHMGAFERVATYKQDEFGYMVPDTGGLIDLLRTKYENELPDVVKDLNQMPSTKYQGKTLMIEMMKDAFKLSDSAITTVQTFFSNGGHMPVPSFAPANIDSRVAEAYWNSPVRDTIDTQLQTAAFTLNEDADATPEEKTAAKQQINGINAQLAQAQLGIDSEKARQIQVRQDEYNKQQKIQEAGATNYVNTTLSMLENGRKELADKLSMFDEAGAHIAATGLATLVENALSDQDEYAKAAQASLATQGIKFDWKTGRSVLDKLWNIEKELAAYELNGGGHEVVVNRKKSQKAEILKEIKGLEKELMGQITAKLVVGASESLKKQIEAAPKIPVGRPKVRTDAKSQDAKLDFDKMDGDKLDKYITEQKAWFEEQGIAVR